MRLRPRLPKLSYTRLATSFRWAGQAVITRGQAVTDGYMQNNVVKLRPWGSESSEVYGQLVWF